MIHIVLSCIKMHGNDLVSYTLTCEDKLEPGKNYFVFSFFRVFVIFLEKAFLFDELVQSITDGARRKCPWGAK